MQFCPFWGTFHARNLVNPGEGWAHLRFERFQNFNENHTVLTLCPFECWGRPFKLKKSCTEIGEHVAAPINVNVNRVYYQYISNYSSRFQEVIISRIFQGKSHFSTNFPSTRIDNNDILALLQEQENVIALPASMDNDNLNSRLHLFVLFTKRYLYFIAKLKLKMQ